MSSNCIYKTKIVGNEKDRETGRYIVRQRGRETGRETDKLIDRQTDREGDVRDEGAKEIGL